MSFSLRRPLAIFIIATLVWLSAELPVAQAQGSLPNDPEACFDESVTPGVINIRDSVEVIVDEAYTDAEQTGDYVSFLDMTEATVPVDTGLSNGDFWHDTSNGGRVWCFRLQPGFSSSRSLADSLEVNFDAFNLPTGSELRIFDDSQNTVLDPFGPPDSNPNGYATGPICLNGPLDTGCDREFLLVAYYEPPPARGQGDIHIASVINGFRDAERLNASLSCNFNANPKASCATSRPWASEIRATVQLVRVGDAGNRAHASAVLLNNTAEDLTPYVYFSEHTLGADYDELGAVFDGTGNYWRYFIRINYQSRATCGLGPVPQKPSYYAIALKGGTVRAISDAGDFALVELPERIPPAYQVYYAGWSERDKLPTEATVVGHPVGDVKKISFADPSSISGSGSRIYTDFDGSGSGAIEGNHSGSPLLNQNRRFVAHAHGAPINQRGCGATGVYSEKLSSNWTRGQSGDQLKDFLAGGTNQVSLPPVAGYDLHVTNETFADSTEDLASGFFRTAGRIDVENVSVQSSSGRLTLRAREGIRIEGPFLAEAGSDFEMRIDDGPTLSELTFPSPAPSGPTVAGNSSGGQSSTQQSERSASGETSRSATDKSGTPTQFDLASSYPNPFRSQTTLRYTLPKAVHVRLVVFDALGRKVATLADARQQAGFHRAVFDASQLSSGTYFYRLTAGDSVETRTMVLVK